VLSLCLIAGATGAGTRNGQAGSRGVRTIGSARTSPPPRSPAQHHAPAAAVNRDASLIFACARDPTVPRGPAGRASSPGSADPPGSHTPPRPPAQPHPPPLAGTDASRHFSWRGRHTAVPRGPADPFWSLGSARRPRARTDVAPPPHSLWRSKSGRGRSSCRSAPEHDNARTGTAGPMLLLTRARPRMDGVRNFCYKPRACVHDTVRGTASSTTCQFRSAPCLPFPAGCHRVILR